MTHRVKHVGYLLAIGAACVAGCGSNAATGGSPSSHPASAVASHSGSASATLSAVAPAPTHAVASPVPARDGDVDGDGRPDAVSVAQSGSGWRLTVAMTRLGTQSLPLAGTTGNPASVEGVVDLDNDGHAEIAVQIDHGASTTFSSIVRLVGGRLAQLKGADGSVARLDSGGSVTHIAVWGCRGSSGSPRQLFQWAGTADATASTYSGTEDTLAIRGDTLIKVSSTSFSNRQPPAGGCGSLHV